MKLYNHQIKCFESVVFTKGNFISVKMSVLQNASPLHENSAEIKQTGTEAGSHVSLSIK